MKHRGRLNRSPKRVSGPDPDGSAYRLCFGEDGSVTPDEFDELVGQALDTIPARLAAAMDNVVVVVEAEPPPGLEDLLGLYEGIPLTERDGWYAGVLPDRISIYRGPILRRWRTHAEVVEEVRVTVVHEIAHHFGIDDDELDDLGYA